MKPMYTKLTAALLTVLAAACSSVPTSTDLLTQAQTDYSTAQNDPKVATYAPAEMKDATDAFNKAQEAAKNHDNVKDIDQLAYVAKQKIATAQEIASQKSMEADMSKASEEREKMRLEARTHEADLAKANAAQSQQVAAQSQQAAADAEGQLKKLEGQLQELNAKKTDRGFVITLGNILFQTDHAHLNSAGMQTLQKLANILEQNPKRTVLIEGFTDNTGSLQHNKVLSERRANTVRAGLEKMGVDGGRITTHGYGPSFPVASNKTAEDRQLNRRVEIVLSDENGNVKDRQ